MKIFAILAIIFIGNASAGAPCSAVDSLVGKCNEDVGTTVRNIVAGGFEVRASVSADVNSLLIGKQGEWAEYHEARTSGELPLPEKYNGGTYGVSKVEKIDTGIDELLKKAKELAAMAK